MDERTKTMGKTALAALVVGLGGTALAFLTWGGGHALPTLRQQEPTSVALPSHDDSSLALAGEAGDAPADGTRARYGIQGPEEETPEWIAPARAVPTAPPPIVASRPSVAAAAAPPATAVAAPSPYASGRTGASALGALMDSSGASSGPGGFGHGGLGAGTIGGGTIAPRARPPMPTSGVLASTFVGGHGAASRLEDLMDRGVMVDGERVRLGAFAPVGPLPYAVPAHDAVALYAELERTQLQEDGEHVHMQIALVARNGERPQRPRMDVRLVVDRSGSMEGEKWQSAIVAAHALVDHLRPGDTFGLVSYSDVATLDRAPARVGDGAAAHRAIDRLVPGGGTNIGDALDVVDRNAPERHGANDVLLVMLLSDGQATVGTTDADSLASRSRAMFERAGIVTTTLGVGTDFDENTMLSIAREGSGSYEFVRRSADIAPILTQELDERALAVAQDLRLRIELSPGVSLARVYGSRVLDDAEAARVRATEVAVDARVARELGIPQDRQTDDETGLRMHIPSFRRGDQHVVLLELVVPPGTGQTAVAHVSLDYKDLRAEINAHAAVDVHAERTADLELAAQSVRRPVKQTVLAFQAGETLREASEALAVGDSAEADRLLGERIELLQAAGRLWHDPSMNRDAHLLASYQRAIGGAWRDWDSSSRHTLVLAMGYYGDQRME